MDARLISDLICKVEALADVTGWRFADADMWPLVRIELYVQLFKRQIGITSTPVAAMAAHALPARLIRPPMSNLLRSSAPKRGDIWLIADGFSYQPTPKGKMDRFCMPLAHACQESGYNSFVADLDRSDSADLIPPPQLWVHHVTARKITSLLAARIAPNARTAFLCDQLNKILRTLGTDVVIDPRAIDARIRAVLSLADYFSSLMMRCRPRAVFMVSYYQVAGYALNLAARRLGIPSVDVQHGVAGNLHAAYGRWTRVPVQGYELLPTVFWTWSQAEAGAIEDSFSHVSGAHRAVCGGHPAVAAWRAGWISGSDVQNERVASLMQGHPASQHILLTLQPGLSTAEELARPLAAMRTLKNRFWWVRLHPTTYGQQQFIEELLRSTGASFNVGNATALPLYALLSKMGLHVTHSSSAVIEAAQFGVRSVIWSRYGADLFSSEIETGIAIAAPEWSDLTNVLMNMPLRNASTPHKTAGQMTSALRTILEQST